MGTKKYKSNNAIYYWGGACATCQNRKKGTSDPNILTEMCRGCLSHSLIPQPVYFPAHQTAKS